MGNRTPLLQATWVRSIDRSGRTCLVERWVAVNPNEESNRRADSKQAA